MGTDAQGPQQRCRGTGQGAQGAAGLRAPRHPGCRGKSLGRGEPWGSPEISAWPGRLLRAAHSLGRRHTQPPLWRRDRGPSDTATGPGSPGTSRLEHPCRILNRKTREGKKQGSWSIADQRGAGDNTKGRLRADQGEHGAAQRDESRSLAPPKVPPGAARAVL